MAEWTRGQDVATVLARADARLYEAKRAGRNCVC
jgi:PleD family two-component response regulator